MRVFGVVAVEIADSLLLVLPGQPVTHEVLNLPNVHKLHVVDMPVFLPLDNHVGRDALVAHGFRIGLMASAGFVDFVSDFRGGEAVVALDFGGVHAFAFQLALFQPVVEGHVGRVRDKFVVEAVHAFAVGAVLAEHFGCPDFILQVHRGAVEALAVGPVVALGLLHFHLLRFLVFLGGHPDAVQAFASRRVIALRSDVAIPSYRLKYSMSLALIPLCNGSFFGFFEATFKTAPSTK